MSSRTQAPVPADGPESFDFATQRSLKRELLAELSSPGEDGAPVSPEVLLERWPADPGADPDVASLLFEDFRQRQERGEQPSIADYQARFPEQQDSLAQIIRRDAVWRSLGGTNRTGGSSVATLALPSVGDELFGFRLRQELGRGAFARVFLAEQADLAGRPVVLKVSGRDGDEPQTLAQLQHTHIVPIYSVHEDAGAGLRGVCMPYFGGASLSHVLRAAWDDVEPPTRGEQLVRALGVVGCPWSVGPGAQLQKADAARDAPLGAVLARMAGMSYLQAAVWILARLAEALQHAHQRGILHRDIKPSNILLSADGEPMLLDFNLAQNTTAPDAQARATLGGTVSYMAPEHLRAVASRDPVQAARVDHRADLYSLGMVLYEMLTGHSPFDHSASYHPLPSMISAMAEERARAVPTLHPTIRRRLSAAGRHPLGDSRKPLRGRADAPWGLESIVRKCLAPDPVHRYQEAEHLAEDLRRFLGDLPLRYAPELSRLERLRKWLRRHPRLTSSGTVATVAAVLLLGTGAALLGVRQHLARTSEELKDIQSSERRQAYQRGAEQALCLVNTTSDWDDHLAKGIDVCRDTLALYGVLDRDDWQAHPDWQRLGEEDRKALAQDTRELLMSLAWARVKTSAGDEAAVREALVLLDRAEGIADLPSSAALWLDRASYLQQLGDVAGAEAARHKAAETAPATARDHYLLATAHVRAGRAAEAVAELDQAVALNSRHYWSFFQRGICQLDRGNFGLAAGDFGVCVGLWPEFAWGHYHRGYAFYRDGKRAEAVADYTAAVRCDPNFLDAYFNRGLAHKELGQFAAALADFDQVARLGRDDAGLHAERGLALERLGRGSEADAAFAAAFARLDRSSGKPLADVRLAYGFAVHARLPNKAREAFDLVLRQHDASPQAHAQAYYGRALLAAVDRPKEAIRFFDRAIETDATLVEARRFRAILHARTGNFAAASQDVQWCLDRDGSGGSYYAAACVGALAAQRYTGKEADAVAAEAFPFLEGAFARGYGRDIAADDPDLAALKKYPAFQQLLDRTRIPGARGALAPVHPSPPRGEG